MADEFPGVDEYPPVLKWRRKPSVVSVSSSLPDLLGSSTGSLTAVDSSFQTDQPLEGEKGGQPSLDQHWFMLYYSQLLFGIRMTVGVWQDDTSRSGTRLGKTYFSCI